MHEEKFSGQDSLAIIDSMINKAKNQFSENGHLYLIWGWTVFICSLLQFVLMNYLHYEKHYLVWISVWLILIYQVFYLRRQKKQRRVRTYTGEIIGYVWLTFVFLLVLFGFILGRVADSEKFAALINPSILALYGMPTFLSGIILKFKPLVTGGICCWLLSVLSTFIPVEYHILLCAVAMVVAWIRPGYLLRKRYRQQQVELA